MNNSIKTILAVMIGVCALQSSAMEFNEKKVMDTYKQQDSCVVAAEKKMNVPSNVLSSIIIANFGYESEKPIQFSNQPAIVAAKEMGVSVDQLKTDKCVSYAAAAMWLMNKSGGNGAKDIWTAVDHFYYGKLKKPSIKHYKTENAKKVYDIITRSSKS